MPAEVFQKTASLDEVLREFSRIKTIVTEAVDDGVRSAFQTIKQGRNAAEDAIGDARRAVKQNPLQAVGVVFAAGLATGLLTAWVGLRRR